ncbi:MAG: GNAT family N-acetyltransferase [Lautropia sp.]|nr:GNAT family N-acetyltransferase [Lautropia sp.]
MDDVHFRRLARADFPMLGAWLAAPHAKRWWNHDPSAAAVEADFGVSVDGADLAEIFIVSDGAQPFGLIQRYTFADNPDYQAELGPLLAVPPAALSIDYLIGEAAWLGRGSGTAMIRAAVAALWKDYPMAPSAIVPVVAANRASWRALERAGFRRIAQGPLAPDNPIDDPLHYVYRLDRPD